MRVLCILILSIASLISSQGVEKSQKPSAKENQNQAARTQDQSPTPTIVQRSSVNPGGADQAGQNKKDPDDSSLWIIILNLVFTGIIAVATAWYVVVTHKMFGGIQQQIKTAEANVSALKNAERAWIMADVGWDTRKTQMKLIHGTHGSNAEKTTSVYVVLTCKNDGKSPAWIIHKRARMRIVEALPKEPEFGPVIEGEEFHEPWTDPINASVEKEYHFTLQCPGQLSNDGRILILYGWIKYRDIFDHRAERYTGFGYMVDQGEFKRLPLIEGFDMYNVFT